MQLQFIMLGASNSGKTSIINKWTRPTSTMSVEKTIGINLSSCALHLNGKLCVTKFWDTSGNDFYESLLDSYIFNADCAIIVFDVTSSSSWEKVDMWVKKIEKVNSGTFPIVIIGNKTDLETRRMIYKQEVKAYVNSHDMRNIVYCECSTLVDEGVKDAYFFITNFAKNPFNHRVYTAKSFEKRDSDCILV